MRVWTSTEFDGHWPVGVAAVIAAETIEDAAGYLSEALAVVGLPQQIKPDQLREFVVREGECAVLRDGNY